MHFFPQGPGPSGKNEEKVTVLTEKIEDLVVQVCNDYVKILFMIPHCDKMADFDLSLICFRSD